MVQSTLVFLTDGIKYVPESAGDLGSEIEASIKIIMKPGGRSSGYC